MGLLDFLNKAYEKLENLHEEMEGSNDPKNPKEGLKREYEGMTDDELKKQYKKVVGAKRKMAIGLILQDRGYTVKDGKWHR